MNEIKNTESELNISTVRKQALRSMGKGAITAGYTLDLEMAYKVLNEALASEILCVLRYRHHQISGKGIDFPQVVAQFKEHALSEERHVLKIAERINQLGGNADFNPETLMQRASTEYGRATELLAMIEEDLVAERIAIETYRNLILWFGDADPTTRRMLEEILADEEEHANDMGDLLAKTQGSPGLLFS
jgi:bacterioferritin